jgi:hypothetical protein
MYTVFMKNITLSAPEEVIEQARIVASLKHQTLNELFREWISELSMKEHTEDHAAKLHALWGKTNYLRVGRKLSRDEMNER